MRGQINHRGTASTEKYQKPNLCARCASVVKTIMGIINGVCYRVVNNNTASPQHGVRIKNGKPTLLGALGLEHGGNFIVFTLFGHFERGLAVLFAGDVYVRAAVD